MRVVVCYPCHDRVHAGFCNDLAHLVGSFVGQAMGPITGLSEYPSIAVNYCASSILPEGRQRLVEFSKKQNASHILWLDSDMRFPKETIHRLMGHGEKIVGCNYPSRRPPYKFTAATLDNRVLITRPGDSGLVEVGHIGFGVLLTDISVFEGDGPWFAFDWQRKGSGEWGSVGEDVFFCREARANGHKVYVDQGLSGAIGHTGEFTFTPDEMEIVEEPIEPAVEEAA